MNALSYVAFFGLFVFLFAGDEAARGHGRRGLMLFLGEVLVFVLADIARLQLRLPAALVFGPLAVAAAAVNIVFIFKVLAGGKAPLA